MRPLESDAPLTVAITGASGALYAVRLLRALVAADVPVRLLVSPYGWRLLRDELGLRGWGALEAATGPWRRVERYDVGDRGATPASGSAPSRGMVICPCSMGTLAALAAGVVRNLIDRAAEVTLKERRPLLLVPRETPLSLIHLENMVRLARAGATILPACPGFYHHPRSVEELVDSVVARVLDHLGVPHELVPRWRHGERARPSAAEEP